MPFPVQRIQTDRGMEFFSEKVQRRLMEYCIKFRPNKPASPHLNGKVERSQKTDLTEFYSTVDLDASNLEDLLAEWQHYYNWFRPHSALGGKSPDERCLELSSITPFWDEVEENYHPEKERLQVQNYYDDLRIRKLKQCL
jgi:transposase InsO family protein